MGTGIVATAGAAMPGLHTPATFVWALDAALLLFLVVAALRRWTWATVRDQLADPVMAQFWGAPPMALMTVGTGALLLGRDWIGLPAALAVDWTLWTVGTLLGLATALSAAGGGVTVVRLLDVLAQRAAAHQGNHGVAPERSAAIDHGDVGQGLQRL